MSLSEGDRGLLRHLVALGDLAGRGLVKLVTGPGAHRDERLACLTPAGRQALRDAWD